MGGYVESRHGSFHDAAAGPRRLQRDIPAVYIAHSITVLVQERIPLLCIRTDANEIPRSKHAHDSTLDGRALANIESVVSNDVDRATVAGTDAQDRYVAQVERVLVGTDGHVEESPGGTLRAPRITCPQWRSRRTSPVATTDVNVAGSGLTGAWREGVASGGRVAPGRT